MMKSNSYKDPECGKSTIGKIFILGLLISGFSTVTFAQATPRAGARQGAQQARIAEGAKSGDLSRKEVRNLEVQQRHINRTKKEMKSDGVVTPSERARLNRKQDRASRNITRQKRD